MSDAPGVVVDLAPGDALSAFLAWRPGPEPEPGSSPGRAPVPVLLSLCVTVALCVALLAVVLVPVATGGHGFSLGHRLLLFCHLG